MADMTDRSEARSADRPRLWLLISGATVFNVFATYYYLAVATVTHPAVMILGLAILWVVWVAAVLVAISSRGDTRLGKAVLAAAPICVVVGAAMYFLV